MWFDTSTSSVHRFAAVESRLRSISPKSKLKGMRKQRRQAFKGRGNALYLLIKINKHSKNIYIIAKLHEMINKINQKFSKLSISLYSRMHINIQMRSLSTRGRSHRRRSDLRISVIVHTRNFKISDFTILNKNYVMPIFSFFIATKARLINQIQF